MDEALSRVVDIARALPRAQLETVCTSLEAAVRSNRPLLGACDAIVNPAVRNSLRQAISACEAMGETAGLPWALRGASAMDHWWSAHNRLDVMWTGPSPASNTFRRTEEALLEIIGASTREMWLVSFAGYKLPNVAAALRAAADRDVKIQMVIESPEQSQGKVTFSTLEGLGRHLAELATVYVWPLEKRPRNERGQFGSLHVKCALADDEHLFVSSANLTEFAMSLNMELGVLARGGALPASIGKHFRWLVEQRILVAVPRP